MKEVAPVVCQGQQLPSNLTDHQVVARKPSPFHRLLSFFDPLLCLVAPVVELYYRFTAPTQVGDNEAEAGKQLARMLFHFGYHATGLVPALGLIGETLVDSLWASGWSVGLLEALA